jgi:hypothetical protein
MDPDLYYLGEKEVRESKGFMSVDRVSSENADRQIL